MAKLASWQLLVSKLAIYDLVYSYLFIDLWTFGKTAKEWFLSEFHNTIRQDVKTSHNRKIQTAAYSSTKFLAHNPYTASLVDYTKFVDMKLAKNGH